MPEALRISSAENPRVKAVVKLREQRERRRTGLFVAEGRRQIERALAAGLRMVEMYVCSELAGVGDSGDPGRRPAAGLCPGLTPGLTPGVTPGVTPVQVTAAVMRKMAYRENPEAVLAVVEQPVWSLNDMARTEKGALWLVTVGVTKPGNLGAMVRSAEAAGGAGVLVAAGVVDAFNPNAIHASTGAVLGLPVVAATSDAVIAFLLQRQARIVAAVVGATAAYTEAPLTGEVALVIGAEDTGLDERWRAAAREHGASVAIPMHGRIVDSLNASTAAAVLLFEAVRQRGLGISDL
ncbi:MAG: RNA methyltransferase [Phycisphaeraceae bacterium]